MRSLRPWLHALLGLALLVQGMALASAPLMPAAPEPAAAQAQAAEAQMPCHGDQAQDPAPAPACDCCHGDCGGMNACMFGHLAAIAPTAQLAVAPILQAVIAAPDRSADSVTPSSRLRPPISRHA